MAKKPSPKKKPPQVAAPKTETALGGAVSVPEAAQDEPEPEASRWPPTIPGKIVAVTTMHREGLDTYGQRFLASFAMNWPSEVKLLCFSEGWDQGDVEAALPPNIHIEPLEKGFQEPDESGEYGVYLNFLERMGGDTSANGWILQKGNKQPVYAYRLDAIRFCHKVYAQHKALKMALAEGAELLIWVDADIYTHTPVPLTFLQEYLPENRDIGYLHRQAADGGLMYPECGFVIYRISRPTCQLFLDLFRQCYDTGDIFKLPEWHDSFVFFVLLQGCMAERGIKANSLSRGAENTYHPFVNSPLGQYMDHMKGERKKAGSSAKADLGDPDKAPAYFAAAPETLAGCPASPFLQTLEGKVDVAQEGEGSELKAAEKPGKAA